MSTQAKKISVLENPEEVQDIIDRLFGGMPDLTEAEDDLWFMFTCTLHEEGDTHSNTRRAWLYRNLVTCLGKLAKYKAQA